MKDTLASKMMFSPEAQDAFWSEMEPDTRASFDFLEQKEEWTYNYTEMPDLFIKTAMALPKLVSLPIDSKSKSVMEKMIPVLATMPLRQCVFAIHWLNDRAGDSPIGWGSMCYLESLNIVNNEKNHDLSIFSRVIVDRISTIMAIRKASGLFAQWPLKKN